MLCHVEFGGFFSCDSDVFVGIQPDRKETRLVNNGRSFKKEVKRPKRQSESLPPSP